MARPVAKARNWSHFNWRSSPFHLHSNQWASAVDHLFWHISCILCSFLISIALPFPSPCSGPRIHWQTIRTALQPIPPAAHHPLLLVCPAHSLRDRLIFLKRHFPYLPQGGSARPWTPKPSVIKVFSILLYLLLLVPNIYSLIWSRSSLPKPTNKLQPLPDVHWPPHLAYPPFPTSVFYNSAASSSPTSNLAFSELCCMTNICLFIIFNQQWSIVLSLWVIHSTLNRDGSGRVIVLVGRLPCQMFSFKNVILVWNLCQQMNG